MENKLNTNTTIELVGHGHPDRFADYLGEKILEECLAQDKKSKVAIEVLATRNSISLGGELTTTAEIDFEKLVHNAIERVYGEKWWPNFKDVKVINHIAEQSPELTTIQDENEVVVAGDQGVIYGYYDVERFETIEQLYAIMNHVKSKFDVANDWKLLYNKDNKELSLSVCGDVNHNDVKTSIEIELKGTRYFTIEVNNVIVNPKGKWLIPGPLADTGVVGRKLMIDTFGAGIPHGGGAFCGKCCSKVDKTGVIIGSYIAKEVATIHGVTSALVELNYKIGDALPKAYAYVDGKKIDVSSTINLTLDQYIKTYGLLDEKWSEYVIKGGVISYLRRDKNNNGK